MKKLIFYLVLVLFAGITNAQEFTELEQAEVEFSPLTSELIRNGNNFSYTVKENYSGEFESDPLEFVKTHFNIKNLISHNQVERIENYFVTFKSKKGSVSADFNNEGDLLKSTSRFKNIALPRELRHQLYKDHKGWIMVSNIHITHGRNGVVDSDSYKVKLVNGKERKNVIFEAPVRGIVLAGN
jgi:hypothetical protein